MCGHRHRLAPTPASAALPEQSPRALSCARQTLPYLCQPSPALPGQSKPCPTCAKQTLALKGTGSNSQGAVRAEGWGVSCWERYLGRNKKINHKKKVACKLFSWRRQGPAVRQQCLCNSAQRPWKSRDTKGLCSLLTHLF